MPRKQNKPHAQFLSDDEGSAVSQKLTSSAPSSDADDILPAPVNITKQQPSPQVKPKADKADVTKSDVPAQVPTIAIEGPVRVNLTDLIAVLAHANASLSGKIDDTGRFELEFDLKPTTHVVVNDDRSITSDESASPPRSRKHRNSLELGKRPSGWTRRITTM